MRDIFIYDKTDKAILVIDNKKLMSFVEYRQKNNFFVSFKINPTMKSRYAFYNKYINDNFDDLYKIDKDDIELVYNSMYKSFMTDLRTHVSKITGIYYQNGLNNMAYVIDDYYNREYCEYISVSDIIYPSENFLFMKINDGTHWVRDDGDIRIDWYKYLDKSNNIAIDYYQKFLLTLFN